MSDITIQIETKRRQVREIDAKLREMPSGTKKRGEAYNTKLMLQMEIDELERVQDSQDSMSADDSPSGLPAVRHGAGGSAMSAEDSPSGAGGGRMNE